MKVFRVKPDSKYQYCGLSESFSRFDKNQRSWAANWKGFEFPIANPAKRRGDFIGLLFRWLVAEDLTEKFTGTLQGDVELLPARLEDESAKYLLWNVTNYVVDADVIDEDKSERQYPGESYPGHVVKFVFRPERFRRAMFFRMVPFPVSFLVTGVGTVEHDFYVQYHNLKMKGLKFELLWEHG